MLRNCFFIEAGDGSESSNKMTKQRSPDELYEREARRRKAEIEFKQLQKQWPEARRTMSAEAITLAWFLPGEKAWTATSS